jgi:hypothetical protein
MSEDLYEKDFIRWTEIMAYSLESAMPEALTGIILQRKSATWE